MHRQLGVIGRFCRDGRVREGGCVSRRVGLADLSCHVVVRARTLRVFTVEMPSLLLRDADRPDGRR